MRSRLWIRDQLAKRYQDLSPEVLDRRSAEILHQADLLAGGNDAEIFLWVFALIGGDHG